MQTKIISPMDTATVSGISTQVHSRKSAQEARITQIQMQIRNLLVNVERVRQTDDDEDMKQQRIDAINKQIENLQSRIKELSKML